MKRKVVQQGAATLMISLPSKWAREKGLKKGHEVNIDEDSGKLVVSIEGLAEKKIFTQLSDQQLWPLSLESLEGVAARKDRLLGGQIREFSVHADTVTARVATEFEFQIAVDCYIGQVGEKKVVKRTVRVGQKMLTFSSSQETANQLLSEFLEEVAQQVVENIQSFLR